MSLKSLKIKGGIPLKGEICIQGSKNGVLPILAASLLGEGPVVLENCPVIGDVKDTLQIMKKLGCTVWREGDVVSVDASSVQEFVIEKEEAARIRSSVLFLGALLGKIKKAVLPQPGGCAIGMRPIDLHLESLRQLGAVIEEENGDSWKENQNQDQRETQISAQAGMLTADGTHMHGAHIRLRFPSVGATENIILAAVMLPGETIVEQAAREPEIDQLCEFLNLRGAKIKREKDVIRIKGGTVPGPVRYRMKADRIVTGTYLLAAAASRGTVMIRNFPQELDALLYLLEKMGGDICREEQKLLFSMPHRAHAPAFVETAPYPGFPTDLQSPLMAVLAGADGAGVIKENVFENRFRTAGQLARMGAQIEIDGSCARVTGCKLCSNTVKAPDLRGGAALALAALQADGVSTITGMEYVERGYEDLARDLRMLGAQVWEER